MKTKFSLQTLDVSGECHFFIQYGQLLCTLYKVDASRPLNGTLLEEIRSILVKEAEKVLNNAYISSLSSLYIYQDDPESAETEEQK